MRYRFFYLTLYKCNKNMTQQFTLCSFELFAKLPRPEDSKVTFSFIEPFKLSRRRQNIFWGGGRRWVGPKIFHLPKYHGYSQITKKFGHFVPDLVRFKVFSSKKNVPLKKVFTVQTGCKKKSARTISNFPNAMTYFSLSLPVFKFPKSNRRT